MYKKPVIVFDMQGISENISDGFDGIICKSNHENGLIAAIKRLKKEMGQHGYKKAVEVFDVKKNTKKIINIYGVFSE